MRKMLLVSYTLLALFGAALLVWIIPLNTEDSGWGLSPALLPNGLAALILGLSLFLLGQTWRSCNIEESPLLPRHLKRLAAFSVILFGSFPLMTFIGFFPGAAITLLLLQLMCGQRDPRWLAGISLGLSGVLYLAMKYVMQVPLP